MATLRLLGGLSLEDEQGPISGRSAQRRRLALLALLATATRPLSRDKLVAYLWPEADSDRARRLLSEAVYVIRKVMGEDALLVQGDEVRLNPDVIQPDVAEFETALAREDFAAAVALYAGPFLDGFFVGEAPEFERWADGERSRYARAYLDALRRLATAADEAGDRHAAARWWRQLAEQDPYSGPAALGLMRALEAVGDRAGAIRFAQVHATLLREELEVEPTPDVQEYVRRLREPAPAEMPAPTAAVASASERPIAPFPSTSPPPSPSPLPGKPAAPGEVEGPTMPAGAGPTASGPASLTPPAAPATFEERPPAPAPATVAAGAAGIATPAGTRAPALVAPGEAGVATPAAVPAPAESGAAQAAAPPEPAVGPGADAVQLVTTAMPRPPAVAPGRAIAASPTEPRGIRGRTRRRIAVVAAALVFLAGLTVTWTVWRKHPAARHAAGALRARSAVVVLPFSIEGGPAVEDLHDGMVDLLSTALDGAGDLRSVDPHAVLAYHRQLVGGAGGPVEADDIAEHFGARFYLLGSVVEAGGRVRLTAQLYDREAGAEPVIRATSQGSTEHLFELVDSVTAQLLVGRLEAPSERLSRLAGLTTRSLPALKAYLQGEQNVRLAHYERAAEAFARAVTLDSSFALAYYRLSAASEWGFDFLRAHAAANRALAFGERLSDPDWLMLRAWASFLAGDAAQAQRQYEDLVANRPDDVEAWAGLGEVFAHYNAERGRSVQDARPAFERALALGGDYGEVRFHLLELAALRGDSATFRKLLAGVLPEDHQYLPWQAVGAYAWGDAPTRTRITARLARADEITLGIAAARVATAIKDFPAAEGLAHAFTGAERPAAWRAGGHLMLVELALAEGRPRAARAELAVARPLEPSWSLELEALAAALPFFTPARTDLLALRDSLRAWRPEQRAPNLTFFFGAHADAHTLLRAYLLGVVSVQLGDVAAAQDYLRELRGSGQAPEAIALRENLVRSLRAWIARREGKPAEALALLATDEFHPALERIALSPFYSRALERFVRAQLLEESGRHAEALRWYATLADGYDFIFAAPSHLEQARIYDRLGDPPRARAHYAQFVRLWERADPELQPAVAAARARLAQLDAAR